MTDCELYCSVAKTCMHMRCADQLQNHEHIMTGKQNSKQSYDRGHKEKNAKVN